jgi:hypothetical protein
MSRIKTLASLKVIVLICYCYNGIAQINHIIPDSTTKLSEIYHRAPEADTTPKKIITYTPNIARTPHIIINRAVLDSLPPRLIDGYVKDDNGNPLSGVSVTIAGTNQGTVTDANGYYKLFSNQKIQLAYSYSGYQSVLLDPEKNNYLSSSGFTITANPSYQAEMDKLTLNVFPIPFPDPSTFYNIPASFFSGDKTFGDVDYELEAALNGCRYDVKKYYYVPDGFAIVTQMERINNDGTSTMPPDRWKYSISDDINDPVSYIKSLFSAPSGDFRVFVFIVTDIDLTSNNQKITEEEAMDWLGNGFTALPQNIKQIPFDDRYHFTMLVYHYNKTGSGENAVQVFSDPLTGRMHYEKAGLINYLGQ